MFYLLIIIIPKQHLVISTQHAQRSILCHKGKMMFTTTPLTLRRYRL